MTDTANIPTPPRIPRSLRVITLALALAVLAIPTQIGAAASTGPVSLKTKREYAHRSASFCGQRRHIRLFHRNRVIEYKGLLTPATGLHFPVRIEVRRCSHRRFVTVAKYHFTGKKSGKFKVLHRVPRVSSSRHFRASYFYARAIVNGQQSAKTYFAVTR